jgi:GntR family transcriptional repressor for pyruvate dehydrogenase complex
MTRTVSLRRSKPNGLEGLRPLARVPVQETLIDRLLEFMQTSKLRPGDRLPTELELGEALGVGRSSMREAIGALVSYGLLLRRAGDGTYLTSTLADLVVRPLKLRLMLSADAVRESFEARRLLEGELAALAAQRAAEADLEQIELSLADMRVNRQDPEASCDADLSFHLAIAHAAKNGVLSGVLQHLSGLLMRTHLTAASSKGMRPRTIAEHVAIAAAIRERDPSEAKRLMHEHIDAAAKHALQRVAEVKRRPGSR